MSEQLTRDILERLADGDLTPAEAEERLRALDERREEDEEDEPTVVLPQSSEGRTVKVSVHGPGMMEIIGEEGAEDVRSVGPSELSVEVEDGVLTANAQLGDDAVLVIPADVDLVTDLHGADAALRNIRGSLQAEVHAGSFTCEAALIRGESRIEAHVGDLNLTLDPSSNVHVVVRAVAMTNVSPRLKKVGRGEWQFGDGSATLEITGNLGSISISVA